VEDPAGRRGPRRWRKARRVVGSPSRRGVVEDGNARFLTATSREDRRNSPVLSPHLVIGLADPPAAEVLLLDAMRGGDVLAKLGLAGFEAVPW